MHKTFFSFENIKQICVTGLGQSPLPLPVGTPLAVSRRKRSRRYPASALRLT